MDFRQIQIALMFFFALTTLVFASPTRAQNGKEAEGPPVKPYVMTSSAVYEKQRNGQPVNPAAVFSVSNKKVYCFSHFQDVRSKAYVFHNWFRRDVSVAKIKLLLQAPKWSIYSSMPLRETEKGPWRVEVTGENGEILSVLRFSIVD